MYKIIIQGLIFILFLSLSCRETQKAEAKEFSFIFDGLERSYLLYLPSGVTANRPLVFVLHGYYGNSADMMTYSEMNRVADQHNFVVCYPQGSADFNGFNHWNANLGIGAADDAGFLDSLAQKIQNDYNLDTAKTFICGHSNGGFMAYHLACNHYRRFKGFGSSSGTVSGPDWQNIDSTDAAAILQFCGADDDIIPMDGNIQIFGNWAGAPSIDSVMVKWAELGGCQQIDSIQINADIQYISYSNCIDNVKVGWYVSQNWGHDWPNSGNNRGLEVSQAFWNFFESL